MSKPINFAAGKQRLQFQRVFQTPQEGDIVNLILEYKHNHWVITSKELPGLFIADQDLLKVLGQIKSAAFGLWRVISNPEKYNARV